MTRQTIFRRTSDRAISLSHGQQPATPQNSRRRMGTVF